MVQAEVCPAISSGPHFSPPSIPFFSIQLHQITRQTASSYSSWQATFSDSPGRGKHISSQYSDRSPDTGLHCLAQITFPPLEGWRQTPLPPPSTPTGKSACVTEGGTVDVRDVGAGAKSFTNWRHVNNCGKHHHLPTPCPFLLPLLPG